VAKWSVNRDGDLKYGPVLAMFMSRRMMRSVARKLNAFEGMLAALRSAENAMVRNNAPFEVDVWSKAVDSVSAAIKLGDKAK
jgi:hypothetical protein